MAITPDYVGSCWPSWDEAWGFLTQVNGSGLQGHDEVGQVTPQSSSNALGIPVPVTLLALLSNWQTSGVPLPPSLSAPIVLYFLILSLASGTCRATLCVRWLTLCLSWAFFHWLIISRFPYDCVFAPETFTVKYIERILEVGMV